MTSILPSARQKNTRQSFSSLPSVRTKTLDKVSQVCRVSGRKHSAKFLKFVECQDKNTRQRFSSLPSVRTKTLGKVYKLCRVPRPNTRQSLDTLPSATPKTLGKQASNGQILWSLCRVSIGIHSANAKHSAKKVPRMTENGLFASVLP